MQCPCFLKRNSHQGLLLTDRGTSWPHNIWQSYHSSPSWSFEVLDLCGCNCKRFFKKSCSDCTGNEKERRTNKNHAMKNQSLVDPVERGVWPNVAFTQAALQCTWTEVEAQVILKDSESTDFIIILFHALTFHLTFQALFQFFVFGVGIKPTHRVAKLSSRPWRRFGRLWNERIDIWASGLETLHDLHGLFVSLL